MIKSASMLLEAIKYDQAVCYGVISDLEGDVALLRGIEADARSAAKVKEDQIASRKYELKLLESIESALRNGAEPQSPIVVTG